MLLLIMQDPSWEDLFAPFCDNAVSTQQGPAITISVYKQQFSLTIADVTKLSKAQFAAIYTVSSQMFCSFVLSSLHCKMHSTSLSMPL